MSSMRLQKYISQCGVASRRAAEEMILEGRVRVNGVIIDSVGASIVPGVDRVTVGKKPVLPPTKGVIVLNKPRNVLTSMGDPGGRQTVADYLRKGDRGYFPVGRLDFDSTGLVVLTNDGELGEQLLHPRYGWERVYRVKIAGVMDEKTREKIRRGVPLKDGVVNADVEVEKTGEDKSWLKVKISVGRNRIIRRLFENLRHPVEKLHRLSHGPFSLGRLQPGEIRVLADDEYRKVKAAILRGRKPRPGQAGATTVSKIPRSSTPTQAGKAASTRPQADQPRKSKSRKGWAKAKPKRR